MADSVEIYRQLQEQKRAEAAARGQIFSGIDPPISEREMKAAGISPGTYITSGGVFEIGTGGMLRTESAGTSAPSPTIFIEPAAAAMIGDVSYEVARAVREQAGALMAAEGLPGASIIMHEGTPVFYGERIVTSYEPEGMIARPPSEWRHPTVEESILIGKEYVEQHGALKSPVREVMVRDTGEGMEYSMTFLEQPDKSMKGFVSSGWYKAGDLVSSAIIGDRPLEPASREEYRDYTYRRVAGKLVGGGFKAFGGLSTLPFIAIEAASSAADKGVAQTMIGVPVALAGASAHAAPTGKLVSELISGIPEKGVRQSYYETVGVAATKSEAAAREWITTPSIEKAESIIDTIFEPVGGYLALSLSMKGISALDKKFFSYPTDVKVDYQSFLQQTGTPERTAGGTVVKYKATILGPESYELSIGKGGIKAGVVRPATDVWGYQIGSFVADPVTGTSYAIPSTVGFDVTGGVKFVEPFTYVKGATLGGMKGSLLVKDPMLFGGKPTDLTDPSFHASAAQTITPSKTVLGRSLGVSGEWEKAVVGLKPGAVPLGGEYVQHGYGVAELSGGGKVVASGKTWKLFDVQYGAPAAGTGGAGAVTGTKIYDLISGTAADEALGFGFAALKTKAAAGVSTKVIGGLAGVSAIADVKTEGIVRGFTSPAVVKPGAVSKAPMAQPAASELDLVFGPVTVPKVSHPVVVSPEKMAHFSPVGSLVEPLVEGRTIGSFAAPAAARPLVVRPGARERAMGYEGLSAADKRKVAESARQAESVFGSLIAGAMDRPSALGREQAVSAGFALDLALGMRQEREKAARSDARQFQAVIGLQKPDTRIDTGLAPWQEYQRGRRVRYDLGHLTGLKVETARQRVHYLYPRGPVTETSDARMPPFVAGGKRRKEYPSERRRGTGYEERMRPGSMMELIGLGGAPRKAGKPSRRKDDWDLIV